ncbi:MAG: hypothetical protein IT457_03360 [Planctomycetes bacterium]|jgi:acetyl-CoA/propionyl-CoA carboxylase biotin carboxyl carrier protein|nr:hypothetical protein [Planctomycetota bacterium]
MSTARDFVVGDGALRVVVDAKGGEHFVVRLGEHVHEVHARRTSDGRIAFRIGDRHHVATVAPYSGMGATHVRLDGQTHVLRPHEGRRRGAAAGGGGVIEAPMTGTLLLVHVKPQDRVVRGQVVAVLSAMKMEHKLVASLDGVVTEVGAKVGATVEQGTPLVTIVPAEPAQG